MNNHTYYQAIPSCTLSRAMLAELEKRLLLGIPKLLGKGLQQMLKGLGLESHHKMENYRIIIEEPKETRIFKRVQDLSTPYFGTKTRKVSVVYQLGAPKVITITFVFPQLGRPYLEMNTQSPQIGQMLPKIAAGLGSSISRYQNRHNIMHNSLIQSLFMLLIPIAAMVYGLATGIAPFPLYASMGWLCLLSLGITMSLPRLFPWVTFETKHRLQFGRLPLLASVSLLVVAIGCYITLILLNMPRAEIPTDLLVAGLGIHL